MLDIVTADFNHCFRLCVSSQTKEQRIYKRYRPLDEEFRVEKR